MTLIATITPMDYDTADFSKIKALRNYARRAVHHGLHLDGEKAPFHGDLIYHQMFNYLTNPHEEALYHSLPLAWQKDAEEIHIYTDAGINHNMVEQVKAILSINPNTPIKFISLKTNDPKSHQKIGENLFQKLLEEHNNKTKFNYLNNLEHIQSVNNGYTLDYHFEPKTIGGIITEKPYTTDFTKLNPVILESPFAGAVKDNVLYGKLLINELARQGYAPTASHLLYTQMLDDTREDHREMGIYRGLGIANNKDSIIGIDRGISGGMIYGIQRAINEGRKYSFTTLSKDPNVIHEVSFLRDLQDAKDYCDMMKNLNKSLFEKTGYIIDTDESAKQLKKYTTKIR